MNNVKLGDKDESGRYITYCSFNGETPEEKKAFFNAISNPESLKDIKGSIDVKDVYLEQVVYKDKDAEPGQPESKDGIRLIMIDKNMKGFKTSSIGVLNAIIRMTSVMGDLPWNPPLAVKSVKKERDGGQTIRIVEFA